MPFAYRALLRLTLGLTVLATGVLIAASDTAPVLASGTFNPVTTITLSSNAANANADITISFAIPSGDLLGGINVAVPPGATVNAAPASIAEGLGDVAGTLATTSVLGIANFPCSPPPFEISFVLLNSTVDTSHTITPLTQSDAGAEGVLGNLRDDDDGDGAPGEAEDGNGLPSHVDHYPSFLNTQFESITPLARYSGSTLVTGQAMLVNVVFFSPGQFAALAAPSPLSDLGDPSFGYIAATVLNDPTQAPAPSPVSGLCTPLTTTTSMFAVTRSNPCAGNTAPPCNTDAAINSPSTSGASTGRVRFANPGAAGTHIFYALHPSTRDSDGDGLENAFDTCAYTATPAFDPRVLDAANDPDVDAMPGGGPAGGCDPTPSIDTDSGNHDGDSALNGAAWLNSADNCPLVNNPTNAEAENSEPDNVARPRGGSQTDMIGDGCDVAETACADALDNDTALGGGIAVGPDGLVNDGCPAIGPAETGCLNNADDDGDGSVNDGCPSSSRVATGRFHTTLTVIPRCIGSTDADVDGWCDSTESSLGSNPASSSSTPEHYNVLRFFPIMHSGSGDTPPASREPIQVCNDGIDNDGDGLTDLLDLTGCKPPNSLTALTVDTDGDGYSDEAEIWAGTDALGRCEKIGPSISTDWPADLSPNIAVDKINISDLSAYVGVPRIYSTSPGIGSNYNQRFDVVPGTGAVPGTWINISDLQSVALGTAPMFGGARMYGQAAACTAHPFYGD